jgi:two-component system phosphate regulon sensor histidine kinase PhoR
MTAETPFPIDYTPSIRDACRIILEEDGYEVETASNGIQGVELITARHFDIILLDLMMPTLSGFEVLAKVKTLHPDSVVIIITGYATLEHSVEAMKKGAFDFIPKPFTPDHLRVVISKALEYTLALRDIANTQSRLRTMVDYLSNGVMCSNRQKAVVFANPAFIDMLGCPHGAEMLGQPIASFIQNSQIREMIDTALQLDQSVPGEVNAEVVIQLANDRRERIFDTRCVPFRDRSGNNIGVITVLHDITFLRHMDQMKSDLVSMVSHEIRSPMNSLLMQLQVIMDGLAGPVTDKQSEILHRASMKIESLSQMTRELLDLASVESGLSARHKEPLSMIEVIRDQVAFYQPQAASRGQHLTLQPADEIPQVMADRRNMEEVLSNLISNAIKYSKDGGEITVGVSVAEDFLCVQVSDNGLGINAEEKEKIFERFYRIKNPQTRFIQGTGLGLALVKAIVEGHQGRIQVDSRLGIGSTFSIFLPIFNYRS